jgi:hypothetical protein
MTNHFDEFNNLDGHSVDRHSLERQSLGHGMDEQDAQLGQLGSDQSSENCRIVSQPEVCSGQRDRFELLSAYLDGEVTAAERRQVETWLRTDASTQQLYRRLLGLRQGLQTLPIVRSEQSVEQLVDRVTARVERQPRRLAWGGLAAAGLLIGALFHALPQEPSYTPSLANSTPSEVVPSDGLMIAINQPPIEIPKASSPLKPRSVVR